MARLLVSQPVSVVGHLVIRSPSVVVRSEAAACDLLCPASSGRARVGDQTEGRREPDGIGREMGGSEGKGVKGGTCFSEVTTLTCGKITSGALVDVGSLLVTSAFVCCSPRKSLYSGPFERNPIRTKKTIYEDIRQHVTKMKHAPHYVFLYDVHQALRLHRRHSPHKPQT